MSRFFAVSPFVCFASIAALNLSFVPVARSQAQPSIAPAADGTGTLATPNGRGFDIDGGTRSLDGTNLFHSFERFSVDAGQSANFLSSPEIQNILGRVVGGDPSIVNGVLEVTGSRANLFLINPSGIVFGADARLNVPGSFAATTATGIGFESGWFNAAGSGNWGELVGEPSAFRFERQQPGRLVNLGVLEVPAGETLSLLGGVVVNGGHLVAPEGRVNAIAVEGGNLLRLSAAGNLLSLEIEATDATTVPSLAELLTGNAIDRASQQLSVSETGEVVLSSSVLPDAGGDAIAAGTIDVSGNLGGSANVLGERVALLGTIDASGTFGGGRVLVGGDVRGGGPIPTAAFAFVGAEGAIDVSALEIGDGGTAIVWADDTTRFLGNISARGGDFGGNGGFVETSGANLLESSGTVDAFAQNGLPGTWLLDPNNITIQDTGPNTNVTGDPVFTTTDDGAIVTTGSIEASLNAGTSVSLATASAGADTEAGDITVADPIAKTAGGDATLTLDADRDIIVNAPISSSAGALNVVLDATGGVDVDSSVTTFGGSLVATGASGLASSGVGVRVGASIDTGGGLLSLVGTGSSGASNDRHGIFIDGASISTGAGAISLTGHGGAGMDSNAGVWVNGSLATDGNIIAIGTGNGTGDGNHGITIVGNLNSTAGAIELTGAGGGGTTTNTNGIDFDASASVRTGGDITLTGTGNGTGSGNDGIELEGIVEATGPASTIALIGTSNGTGSDANRGINIFGGATGVRSGGTLALTGVGGNGTFNNFGISLGAGSTVRATGDITAIGTGGNGSLNSNHGILTTGTFDSTGGAIELTGVGGGGDINSEGIVIESPGAATANGNILLHGTGGNSATDNDGIVHLGTIYSTGSSISLVGAGGNLGSANHGIEVSNGALRAASSITLQGTGGASGDGIVLDNNNTAIVSMGGGTISLVGDSGPTGGAGITLVNDPTIQTGGNITLEGTGTDGHGLDLRDGTIAATGAGTLALTGTTNSGFDNQHGIFLQPTAAVRSQNGNITLTGTNNGTASNQNGIFLQGTVESTGGSIALMGTGGGTGGGGDGIDISGTIIATGAASTVSLVGTSNGTGTNADRGINIFGGQVISGGTIDLTGSGGNGTDNNWGVALGGSSVVRADGNITATGTGNGSGNLNHGILIDSSTLESTGTSATVSLMGTSNSTTGNNHRGIEITGATAVVRSEGAIALTGVGGNGVLSNDGIRVTGGGQIMAAGAIELFRDGKRHR